MSGRGRARSGDDGMGRAKRRRQNGSSAVFARPKLAEPLGGPPALPPPPDDFRSRAAAREKKGQALKERVKRLQMDRLDAPSVARLRAASALAMQVAAEKFGRGKESVWAFLPLEANPYAVLATGARGPAVPRRNPVRPHGDAVKAASNSLIPKARSKSKAKPPKVKAVLKGRASKKKPPVGREPYLEPAAPPPLAAQQQMVPMAAAPPSLNGMLDDEVDEDEGEDEDNEWAMEDHEEVLSDHWSDFSSESDEEPNGGGKGPPLTPRSQIAANTIALFVEDTAGVTLRPTAIRLLADSAKKADLAKQPPSSSFDSGGVKKEGRSEVDPAKPPPGLG